MLTIRLMHGLQWSNSLRGTFGETNQSELAAFTSYALAFPSNFLALVDTYDVSESSAISSRYLLNMDGSYLFELSFSPQNLISSILFGEIGLYPRHV